MKNEEELREKLSELEHIQWCHIIRPILEIFKEANKSFAALKANKLPVAEKIAEKIQTWERDMVEYDELSEFLKDYDREWADKVLKIMKTR